MKCGLVDKRNESTVANVFFDDLSIGNAVLGEEGFVRLKISDSGYLYKNGSDSIMSCEKFKWPESGVQGEVVNMKLTMEVIAL
jgi:hypothetical protein